ncbi:MAG TPA: GNAT family N-acetyltransferase [Candidatus Competibacteraceae bacterium]|nr:GNAT family N-acetyltransferase [Candidatus Competibacteraceae bacterium]
MPIRHAQARDLPAIVAIYNASIPARLATADLEPVSVESQRAWFESFEPERRPLWVLEEDGIIAGWLSLRSFYGRLAYHATVEVGVYVAPEFQGRGIGRRLLEHAIREAPVLGIKTLLGFVFSHNQTSLRLFESLGFRRWGELPDIAELDGVERSLTLLGRRVA